MDTLNSAGPSMAKHIYIFEVFRGAEDKNGVIQKQRPVGMASLLEGQETYRLNMKTLLGIDFFIIKERKHG